MRFPIFEDFLSLVLPKTCCLCKRSLYEFENQLCKICIAALPVTHYHQQAHNNELIVKIMGLTQPRLVFAFLRFTKKGESQKLLHLLKYKSRPEIGVELGKLYGQILMKNGFANTWDLITPVPLHPLKQKRRGYNQSEQFAIGLSEALDVPVSCALIRVQDTETQTKKSRMERLDNVSEVFETDPLHRIAQQKILLVDDVMTTGATLATCANVLLDADADFVDMAVLAAGKN
jgi:ComF family protein